MEEQRSMYKQLRDKISKYANSEEGKKNKFLEYLLIAPDLLHLLVKLMMDSDVKTEDKVSVGLAIAYFVSPIDFVPDVILGAGQLDDIVVAAFALNIILNNNPEIVKRHWAGEKDILETVKNIIKFADEMVGSGLLKKIFEWFSRNK